MYNSTGWGWVAILVLCVLLQVLFVALIKRLLGICKAQCSTADPVGEVQKLTLPSVSFVDEMAASRNLSTHVLTPGFRGLP